ncbi:MAG TPA: hypothetical protein VHG08_03815, partial [Longimicrobium sp.]|nr:hypothetical protein [Longimicrobium sp.]
TEQWGLPTEPYVFVVDSSGNVTAKFEGIASAEELRTGNSTVVVERARVTRRVDASQPKQG